MLIETVNALKFLWSSLITHSKCIDYEYGTFDIRHTETVKITQYS